MASAPPELFEPGVQNQPLPYLRKIWSLRHYLWASASGLVEGQHRDKRLGRAWLYFEPVLDMSVWFLIFGVGFRAGREIPGSEPVDFLSYLVIGFTGLQLMREMFNGAVKGLKNTRAIPFDFPRGVNVIAGYVRIALQFRYQLLIAILLLAARGNAPRWQWFLLPGIGLAAILLGAGIGFYLARLGANRDGFALIFNKLSRFLTWSSGVILPVEGFILRLDNGEQVLQLYALGNPVYAIIKLFQWAGFGYSPPALATGAVGLLFWCTVPLVTGFVFMVRGEANYRERG